MRKFGKEIPSSLPSAWGGRVKSAGMAGKVNYIIDNLLAEGKCEEMIIVMNNGYAFKDDGTSHPAREPDEVIVRIVYPLLIRNIVQ